MSTSAPESESPAKRASDLAYTDRPATDLTPLRPYSAIKFADLCELFEAVRGVNQTGLKGSKRKRALLDAFHRTFCITEGPRTGAFDLYRLILPTVDKERAAYKLKEAALAHCIGLALGLKRGHSPDFLELEGWRKSGKGNFAQTVYDVCKGHRPPHLGDVRRATVGDVSVTRLVMLGTFAPELEREPAIHVHAVAIVVAVSQMQLSTAVALRYGSLVPFGSLL
jgi:hypothetical protein